MKHALFLLPVLALAVGCGEGAPEGSIVEGIVPVSGMATYQGKPLQDYAIYFGDGKTRPSAGMVNADGRFTLTTNKEGDGAPVGTHKVWFSYSPPAPPTPPGQEEVDAPVLPPSVKLPAKYTNMKTTDVTVEVPQTGLTDYKIELK